MTTLSCLQVHLTVDRYIRAAYGAVMADSETTLARLRTQWGQGWTIFQAYSYRDVPGEPPTGAYVAARLDRPPGADASVVETDLAAFERQLARWTPDLAPKTAAKA